DEYGRPPVPPLDEPHQPQSALLDLRSYTHGAILSQALNPCELRGLVAVVGRQRPRSSGDAPLVAELVEPQPCVPLGFSTRRLVDGCLVERAAHISPPRLWGTRRGRTSCATPAMPTPRPARG